MGDSESDGVDEVAGPADLVRDIAAAVERCCGEGLAPYYRYVSGPSNAVRKSIRTCEEEGDIVNVCIHCIKGL